MLVLARRQGESLVFPELDIALEVLSIKGSQARLGVKAPHNITVLRGELAESRRKFSAMLEGQDDPQGQRMHRIRNWLHVAELRMQLIRRYLEADRVQAAAGLIQKVLDDFRAIDEDHSDSSPQMDVSDDLEITQQFEAASAGHLIGKRTALLVEDNANERQLLAAYLRGVGFQVETAGDGGSALDYLSCQAKPDVVLLDMVMPNCDGPTLLRRIRRDCSINHLKVFAISGTSPSICKISIGPDGVDRWFEKPVDPQFLANEILRELEVAAHATVETAAH